MNSNLYQLNRDIIHKCAGKKVLWQPRILSWYADREFLHQPLPGKYEGCTPQSLYEKLGCSDRLYDYFNPCLEVHYDSSIRIEQKPVSGGKTERDFQRIIHTPVGDLSEIYYGNNSNYGMMPHKWMLSDVDDLRALCYLEEATSYSFNRDTYEKMLKKVGHLGLPTLYFPRVNIQKLLIELCGVENTYYLLADYPEKIEHYFSALSKSQERLAHVLAESPLEWINYGDNLHCKILPDYLFERYVIPEYEKRAEILHKTGKFLFSYWDGDCKDYLKYAKTCYLDGIEAITPMPQGDVTLEEIKEALGDEITLIDGIPAVMFTDTYPEEALTEMTHRIIDMFAGNLILGISDEMPSTGLIERVELVNKIVNEHNAKVC